MSQRISEDLLWSQIVARAWSDGGFMSQLRSNPRAVFTEYGLEVPQGTQVAVVGGPEAMMVDESDSVRHFILPVSPPDELTEEDLVGTGVAYYCGACGRCGGCGCRCRC